MRLVSCVVILVCLCMGSAGCALFNKQSAAKNPPPGGSGSDAAKTDPQQTSPSDPLLGRSPQAPTSGLLAGQVEDRFTGRPVSAYLRYECLDDGKQEQAPIDVTIGSDGFFVIQGLKPGKQYKLTARAKQGDHMIVGVIYTRAPNPRVVIKLDQELSSKDTPDPPRPSVYPGDKAAESKTPAETPKKTSAAERPAAVQGSSWEQAGVGASPGPPRDTPPIGIRAPQPLNPGDNWQGPAEPQEGWKRNVVKGPSTRGDDWQRPAEIRGGPDPWANGPAAPPPKGPLPTWPMGDPRGAPASSTPAPFCSLVGDRLYNMALPELNGGTWEWRSNRLGKLVLLDFWATYCIPCKDAIPHLKLLQGQYGVSGLEVIGIACEAGGSLKEQNYRVASVCNRLQTNYRLLLASGPQNPVRAQFGIHSLPTLILLDENGQIVWRHQGGLDQSDVRVLEREIKTRLAVP